LKWKSRQSDVGGLRTHQRVRIVVNPVNLPSFGVVMVIVAVRHGRGTPVVVTGLLFYLRDYVGRVVVVGEGSSGVAVEGS
jgi:hypothetical protein